MKRLAANVNHHHDERNWAFNQFNIHWVLSSLSLESVFECLIIPFIQEQEQGQQNQKARDCIQANEEAGERTYKPFYIPDIHQLRNYAASEQVNDAEQYNNDLTYHKDKSPFSISFSLFSLFLAVNYSRRRRYASLLRMLASLPTRHLPSINWIQHSHISKSS